MQSFENEYKNLIKWYSKDLEKAKRTPYSNILDGEQTIKFIVVDSEYRRRFRLLKNKYNINEK